MFFQLCLKVLNKYEWLHFVIFTREQQIKLKYRYHGPIIRDCLVSLCCSRCVVVYSRDIFSGYNYTAAKHPHRAVCSHWPYTKSSELHVSVFKGRDFNWFTVMAGPGLETKQRWLTSERAGIRRVFESTFIFIKKFVSRLSVFDEKAFVVLII